jgi:ABC-type branched-subunit amino acid transport system permease subunit
MNLLSIAADVLWILALSIMASSARAAWNRIDAETRLPLVGGWRAPRNLTLTLPILAAVAVGLILLWGHHRAPDLAYNVIFFGLRATLAAVIAMIHLQWLRKTLETLEAEGSLKP